jgi:hypothetical protein
MWGSDRKSSILILFIMKKLFYSFSIIIIIGISLITIKNLFTETVSAEAGGYYQGVVSCSCKSGLIGERAACIKQGTTACTQSATGNWLAKCAQDDCYQADHVCDAGKILCVAMSAPE